MFNKIPEAKVLVRYKGNYKVLDLYEYKTEVYAKNGNGFIKIMVENMTSNGSYKWIDLHNIQEKYIKSVLVHETLNPA